MEYAPSTLSLNEDIANGELKYIIANSIGNTVHTLSEYQTFSNGAYYYNYYDHNSKYLTQDLITIDRFTFCYDDSRKMLTEGSTFDFALSNIYSFWSIEQSATDYGWTSSPVQIKFFFRDIDGNTLGELCTDFTFTPNGRTYSISCKDIEVPCDTYYLGFYVYFYYSASDDGLDSYMGEDYVSTKTLGLANSKMNISETLYSETNGLLDTIIQWLTSIRDNIVNLPSLIANAIKGFFDNIVNAITNMVSALQEKLQSVLDGIVNKLTDLGNFLIDGIKGLFVPDSDTLAAEKDKWDELLESRFGALYEVIALIDDYAQTFQASEKGTITMPEVTIPLGDADFVFGGWEVKIIPDGFSVLIDALKLIISISATILFVNGLRNRFERVVDG